MKKPLYILILLLFLTINVRCQVYQAEWESLDQRQVPEWWKEAKFGIFIHWGPYAVPAYAPVNEVEGVYEKYAEHYENRLLKGNEHFLVHHNRYYGEGFKYRDFAPMFQAQYFNPDDWAELFKRSGAKYVVLTSKHHDGFCLWPSKQSPDWNSMDVGAHRDLLGDLTTAVRKKGLRMGLYYSLLEWSHPLYKEATMDRWVSDHMIPQLKDLVNSYQPEIIFADGEWDYTSEQWQSESFLSWLYNESPVKNSVVVNDRWGKETRGVHGGYFTTEYDHGFENLEVTEETIHPWEESRGIGTSYGYNRFETIDHYSTTKQLIDLLIEKVSSGGNLLLNVGPTADGLIPVIMQERLVDIGDWLQVNGEAIYGTKPWEKRPGDMKEKGIFYTKKDNSLYIICTKWPENQMLVNHIAKAGKVNLLGSDIPVKYDLKGGKLYVDPPSINPGNNPSTYAWVFKVTGFE